MAELGIPKLTLLKTLNHSPRMVSLVRSNCTLLKIPKSVSKWHGPVKMPVPELPNVSCAGATESFRLNQWRKFHSFDSMAPLHTGAGHFTFDCFKWVSP